MNKKLSIKDSILYAVNGVVSHPWYFIKMFLYWVAYGILLMIGLLALIVGLVLLLNPVSIQTINHVTDVTINPLSFFIVNAMAALALIYYGAATYFVPIKLLLSFEPKSPRPFTFGDFYMALSFKTVLKLFGASILFGIIVIAGLICLIIPGIYFAVKFQWVFYYIMDKNTGIIEGLKRSYARTTGNFWQLLAIDIIAMILYGLVILIPVAYLMRIRAYKKINN